MADIKITLETLYDILRNEKKREDLQRLEATFFLDVVAYIREKHALLEQKQKSNELFAAGERDKLEYELRSIKRILKEIYDKREKKIIDIAVNKARTGSDIIDTSAMLFEEKEFYQRMLRTMNGFRQGVLFNLLNLQLPSLSGLSMISSALSSPVPEANEKQKKEQLTGSLPEEQKSAFTKIKLIHPLPSFIWKDLKVYGPYDEGVEVEMYSEVAELIIRKGRAVKV